MLRCAVQELVGAMGAGYGWLPAEDAESMLCSSLTPPPPAPSTAGAAGLAEEEEEAEEARLRGAEVGGKMEAGVCVGD